MRVQAGKQYRCREGHLWRTTGRVESVGKAPDNTLLHEIALVRKFAFSPQDGVEAYTPPKIDYVTQMGFWYISESMRSSRDLLQEIKPKAYS